MVQQLLKPNNVYNGHMRNSAVARKINPMNPTAKASNGRVCIAAEFNRKTTPTKPRTRASREPTFLDDMEINLATRP